MTESQSPLAATGVRAPETKAGRKPAVATRSQKRAKESGVCIGVVEKLACTDPLEGDYAT
jgi:hypothetical protein